MTGVQLRRMRESAGVSREQIVSALAEFYSVTAHVVTLQQYEEGSRPIPAEFPAQVRCAFFVMAHEHSKASADILYSLAVFSPETQ